MYPSHIPHSAECSTGLKGLRVQRLKYFAAVCVFFVLLVFDGSPCLAAPNPSVRGEPPPRMIRSKTSSAQNSEDEFVVRGPASTAATPPESTPEDSGSLPAPSVAETTTTPTTTPTETNTGSASTPQDSVSQSPTQTSTQTPGATPGLSVKSTPSPAAMINPEPVSGPQVISLTRVVGEVGDYTITSREVQISEALEQAVFGRFPGQMQIRFLKGIEKSFDKNVDNVLHERAVAIEAKSFESAEIPKADLFNAIKTANDSLATQVPWENLEPTAQEVSEILERKLIAKKFLRLKTESAQVPVTDAEAMAYYKKNRIKFGNLPFTSFRDNIKTFLLKQQMDRRLQEWLQVLERKYRVRNFIAG